MKILRRCNVWDMEVGEHCFHNDRVWVRCPSIEKRMLTLGRMPNAVLRPVDDMETRQLFLHGIDVDVIDYPGTDDQEGDNK